MRYKHIAITAALTLPMLSAAQVHAADVARGKELHDSHCTQCHIRLMGKDGSEIYTRENRRIHSLNALDQQVHRCKDSMGADWPDDKIEDVVAFLNQKYYHFDGFEE